VVAAAQILKMAATSNRHSLA